MNFPCSALIYLQLFSLTCIWIIFMQHFFCHTSVAHSRCWHNSRSKPEEPGIRPWQHALSTDPDLCLCLFFLSHKCNQWKFSGCKNQKPHGAQKSSWKVLYWTRLCSRLYCSSRCHCVLDPWGVVADLGVDPRLVSQSAALSPRHDSLELSTTHHRTTGVTLRVKERGVYLHWCCVITVRLILVFSYNHETFSHHNCEIQEGKCIL